MAGREQPRQQIETAALNLLLEAAAGEVSVGLQGVGERSILLKGTTTTQWLYESELRSYGDVDLLVDPAAFPNCECAVETMGFKRSPIERVFAKGRPSHASTWTRGAVVLDLHRAVIGIGVPAGEAWTVLAESTEVWVVGGEHVEVLCPAARCLVLALHMAQHGPEFARTKEDLARAMAHVPEAIWGDAAKLSRLLAAEMSMSAGLGAVGGGERMSADLGLRIDGTVAVEGSASFHAAQGLLWFFEVKGLRAKSRYLRFKLFPPKSLIRSRVEWARGGRLPLGLAYVLRFVKLTAHAPRAALDVARVWRERRRR